MPLTMNLQSRSTVFDRVTIINLRFRAEEFNPKPLKLFSAEGFDPTGIRSRELAETGLGLLMMGSGFRTKSRILRSLRI